MQKSPLFQLFPSLILLALVAPAPAQIDHRTNTGNIASGQANDANPQIGSNGYNLTRPGLFDAGITSNAIVTNNVTGLAGFRGFSPIPQATAFREALPSAEFTNFFARSVSINELPSFSQPRPTLFLGRPQTVTDAGFARNNFYDFTRPGSTNIATQSRFNPSIAQRPINLPNPADRRIQGPQEIESLGIRQQTLSGRDTVPSRSAASFNSAVTSPIFGLQPARTISGGADRGTIIPGQTISEVLANLRSGDDDEDPLRQFEKPRGDGLNSPFARNAPERKGLNTPFKLKPSDIGPDRTVPDRTMGVDQRPLNPEPVQAQVNTPANLGADRFADLYNAVRIAEQAGVRQLSFRPIPKAAPEPTVADEPVAAEPTPRPAPAFETLVRTSREGIDQIAAQHRWAGAALEDPITTFAGKFKNDLNRYIAAAEMSLQRGEFYKAAGQFELASTIDPRNPLPLLGRGHALVAAGDYASGIQSILSGIEQFPQIAAFRLDLPAIVGNQDIFDRRRADLTSRLEKREDSQMRFLLGYLELYSGLSVEGFRDLEIAAGNAPSDGTISKFFRLVSGKEQLPPVAPD